MGTLGILNDVLGPVMRGPSSSHTAGAWRIARIAAQLAGGEPARARVSFDPSGSYAPTYRPLGVDLAVASALLGWDPADERYPRAVEEAARRGLDLSFAVEPLEDAGHPNTARLEIAPKDGPPCVVWARSIGGGMVDVYRLDDRPCRIDGKAWALWVRAAAGRAGEIVRRIAPGDPILRETSGAETILQWDLGQPPAAEILRDLRAAEGILDLRVVDPLMYVPRGPTPFGSARELLELAAGRGCGLGAAARFLEARHLGLPEGELDAEMLRRYEVMRSAVALGMDDARVPLSLAPPSASRLREAAQGDRLPLGGRAARAAARGLAALHACNARGLVCAAPTGGSSGVLPGVLVTLAEEEKWSPGKLSSALFAAGGVGLVVAARGTFAAEEAGCQVEIGAASAMAAAAAVDAAGGGARQAADAASISLQNTMGLVCDPVGGGCEIPCHTRTASAVANAFVCADLVLAGYANPIPLDEAVDASIAVDGA